MTAIYNELKRIKVNSSSLLTFTKRIRANDASKYNYDNSKEVLKNYYYLKDHLKIQPNLKHLTSEQSNVKIMMTKPEIGCALSHIDAWKKIAHGEDDYCLIIEDDIFFCRSFSKKMDAVWEYMKKQNFDILYLSFSYADIDAKRKKIKQDVIKASPGIWNTSGYIVSKKGAKKLLRLLPVYGPVDLWLNLNFDRLNVFIIKKPIIMQRKDFSSNNNYSVLSICDKL